LAARASEERGPWGKHRRKREKESPLHLLRNVKVSLVGREHSWEGTPSWGREKGKVDHELERKSRNVRIVLEKREVREKKRGNAPPCRAFGTKGESHPGDWKGLKNKD